MKQVFVAFCQFASKNDPGVAMSGTKFKKFCVDSGLLDKKFIECEINIIFEGSKTVGKKTISFSQFVNTIKIITGKKYPKEKDLNEKFKKVIKQACNAEPFEVGTTDSCNLGGKLDSSTGAVKVAKEEEKIELNSDDVQAVKETFVTFSKLGGISDGTTMNVSQFSKFSKDAGLSDEVGAGIAFTSAAGSGNKTITFDQFPTAMRKLFPKISDSATALNKAVQKAKSAKPDLTGVSKVDKDADNFTKSTGNVQVQKENEVIKLEKSDVADVKATFELFSKLGGISDGTTMNVSQFSKFSKDAGLSDEVGAGIAFTSAAGSGNKTITFDQFPRAIRLLFPKISDSATALNKAVAKTKGVTPTHDGTAKAEDQGSLEEKTGVYARGGGSNKDKDQDLSALANRGVKTDARGVAISQTHH